MNTTIEKINERFESYTQDPTNLEIQKELTELLKNDNLKLLGLINPQTQLPKIINNGKTSIIPVFTSEDHIEDFCQKAPIFKNKVIDIKPITIGRWLLYNNITINPHKNNKIEFHCSKYSNPYPTNIQIEASNEKIPQNVIKNYQNLDIQTTEWYTNINIIPIKLKLKESKKWGDGYVCAIHTYPNANAKKESLKEILETITKNPIRHYYPVIITTHIKPELHTPTNEVHTFTYGINETL